MGSEFNIFLTRSFAAGDMLGHGSVEKSMWPLKMALNIPFSDSVKTNSISQFHIYYNMHTINTRGIFVSSPKNLINSSFFSMRKMFNVKGSTYMISPMNALESLRTILKFYFFFNCWILFIHE